MQESLAAPPRGRLEHLRRHIERLERAAGGPAGRRPAQPFGVDAVDALLPEGGLPRHCLHEVTGGAAALGFAAALLGRLAGPHGTVVWCLGPSAAYEEGNPYGPGLAAFGLDPARLLLVRSRARDRLWAMEEALRSGRPAAVLGQVDSVDLTASRRLQLAAETGGVTAVLLSSRQDSALSSVAVTRWRVAAVPSGHAGVSPPAISAGRWQVDLVRCRGGAPRSWLLEWSDAQDEQAAGPSGGLGLAAELPDRPAQPARQAVG